MYLVVKRTDKPEFRGHQYRPSKSAKDLGPAAERRELVAAFRQHLQLFTREKPKRGPEVILTAAHHCGVLYSDDGTEIETLGV